MTRAMSGRVLLFLTTLDFVLRLKSVLALVPAAVVTSMLFGASMKTLGPTPVLVATMAMVTWGHHLRATHDDEKTRTWPFLRALPLSPQALVTARIISTAAALLIYAGLATTAYALTLNYFMEVDLGWRMPLLGGGSGLAVGLVLTSLFHAVYFRAGYRAANSVTSYVMLLVILPFLVLTLPPDGPGLLADLSGLGSQIGAWVSANPAAAIAVAVVISAGAVAAGWTLSVTALSRSEFR